MQLAFLILETSANNETIESGSLSRLFIPIAGHLTHELRDKVSLLLRPTHKVKDKASSLLKPTATLEIISENANQPVANEMDDHLI